MDGVHDMGGMHGFGRMNIEVDEPVFHESWEGRTFGLMIATAAADLRSGSVRPGIEELDPAVYLAASYYERWACSVEAGLIRAGTLTTSEIDARVDHAQPAREHGDDTNPALAKGLVHALVGAREPSGADVAGRYFVGDHVTVKRMAPPLHHRCPRYVRGVSGMVTGTPGGWPHASNDEPPEATYTVRFAMSDLWGADAEPGWVYIDLWDRYLE